MSTSKTQQAKTLNDVLNELAELKQEFINFKKDVQAIKKNLGKMAGSGKAPAKKRASTKGVKSPYFLWLDDNREKLRDVFCKERGLDKAPNKELSKYMGLKWREFKGEVSIKGENGEDVWVAKEKDTKGNPKFTAGFYEYDKKYKQLKEEAKAKAELQDKNGGVEIELEVDKKPVKKAAGKVTPPKKTNAPRKAPNQPRKKAVDIEDSLDEKLDENLEDLDNFFEE